ncbi:MAG TPA: FlgD immunoglobulin-like domain containing protein, partial [Bacteroidota bacterium]
RASGPQSLGTALGGRIAGAVDINGHLVGGDILLIVDYTNGGSKPVISIREWSTNAGGSWFLIADSLTTGKAFIVTNNTNVPAVAPGQGVSPNGSFTDTTVALQFVEFGIDLTGLNLLPIDPCNPLATVLFQTRSSASFTSSLMDFALGKFAVIPAPQANAGPDQAVCTAGDVTTFTLAGSAANGTPLWSVLSGRVAIADPTSLTSTITDTGTGTAVLLLTTTSDQNCGAATDTVVFTVNPNPTVSVNNVAVCGGTSGTLTATASGGTPAYSYHWSNGATTSTITTSTAGTYSVTVTDSKGCTGTGSGSIGLSGNPTVSVPPDSACPGTARTLTANASGGTPGYTYLWSTGATTSTISTSTAGTYSVTITDSKGCTGSGSGTFRALTPPTASATGGTITCFEPCVTISASPAGATYSWTGPGGFTSTSQSPSVCDSGTYSVTVTDANGCTGTATAHVAIVLPQVGTCGAGGAITQGFELDGDATAVAPNPPDDWNLIYNGTAHPTETTGIVVDFPSKADDHFVIGTKDIVDVTQWHYSIQSTPDKDDILNAGAAEYGTQLYFFGDRYAVNGNAQIGFWFFQDTVHILPNGTFAGHHEVGDLLVLSNFVGGGGTPVIFAYEWVGSGGSDGTVNALTLSASNSFAITNSTVSSPPWPYKPKMGPAGQYPKGAFFEGGIDVACLPGINPCFASFLIETRSSQSVTAELKDFVIGNFVVGSAAQALAGKGSGAGAAELSQVPAKPSGYALRGNYPNPFNPTTQIKFDLPEASQVRLSVFNVLGQEVATLVNGVMGAGYQSVEWNSSDHQGVPLPSGVYFYRLQATSMVNGKEFRDVMKMVLMK